MNSEKYWNVLVVLTIMSLLVTGFQVYTYEVIRKDIPGTGICTPFSVFMDRWIQSFFCVRQDCSDIYTPMLHHLFTDGSFLGSLHFAGLMTISVLNTCLFTTGLVFIEYDDLGRGVSQVMLSFICVTVVWMFC